MVGPSEKIKNFAPFVSGLYRDFQDTKTKDAKFIKELQLRTDKIEPTLIEAKRNAAFVPTIQKEITNLLIEN